MALKDLVQDAVISDETVVERVRNGETYLFEIVMRRYNQRLFRVIRSILRSDQETEDVMQETYVRAFEHLHQFEGRAKFSTWLTKIGVYEAYARLRDRNRVAEDPQFWEDLIATKDRSPEEQAFSSEMRSLLEQAIDTLREEYRAVLVLRDVEGMSTTETAEALDISEENAKVRLFRARALMRRKLMERVYPATAEAFPFMGARCDRMVENVLRTIAAKN